MAQDDINALVIDNGSGICKAGFASSGEPTCVFPSFVGRPYLQNVLVGGERKQYYIGNDAQEHRAVLKLSYPIEHGFVTNWDDMNKIWYHTFYNELKVDPENYHVLLTEAPLNPRANRERMAKLMFEEFMVKGLYVSTQAVLSLNASGEVTGCVLDIGDGVTHCVAIYEGYAIPHASSRLDLAGRDVNNELVKLLLQRGHNLTSSVEREIVRDLKERLCYVAIDFEAEKVIATVNLQEEYELPDGQVIVIDTERFSCPEILFKPSIVGNQLPGVAEMLVGSIKGCQIDTKRELFGRIVLSGGSTKFPGFPQRLSKDVRKLVADSVDVNILDPPERQYSVFTGGTVVARAPTLDWITRQDYLDHGSSLVHDRCK